MTDVGTLLFPFIYLPCKDKDVSFINQRVLTELLSRFLTNIKHVFCFLLFLTLKLFLKSFIQTRSVESGFNVIIMHPTSLDESKSHFLLVSPSSEGQRSPSHLRVVREALGRRKAERQAGEK